MRFLLAISLVLLSISANALSLADEKEIEPFGTSLFAGQFAADTHDGLSESYKVQSGDKITVNIWGAVTFNEVVEVDSQGNIFLPEIGPVNVGGTALSQLNSTIEKELSKTYTDNVKIYTNIEGSQPISVFVTGEVTSPGRYSGTASDSVLHYIDRAGGINLNSGSFRKIEIKRGARIVSTIDLYKFLTEGIIPNVQLKENDTILIKPIGTQITIMGEDIREAKYEFINSHIYGSEVLKLTNLQKSVTKATIIGNRNDVIYNEYVDLKKFKTTRLGDGFKVIFSKKLNQFTKTIRVEGENLSEKIFIVPNNAKLRELLANVEVNTEQADYKNVYIERKSVAKRQKEALNDSLFRLEQSIVSKQSSTAEESSLKTSEAQLLQGFIEKAKEIKPKGQVVVSNNNIVDNILLEDGDIVYIPSRTDIVMVTGEVTMPRAVVHQRGKNIKHYIKRAGNYSERADKSRVLLLRANREIINASLSTRVNAGDEIMVLPEIFSDDIQLTKDIADIFYKIAVAIAIPFSL